jgi:cytochrome c
MRSCNALVVVGVLAWTAGLVAQSPTYHLGRTPSEREVRAWDTAIGPDGRELPKGRGTAKDGLRVYDIRGCAGCHGPTGTEGPAPRLVGGVGSIATDRPVRTVGSFWPFATSIWDYINRAMPLEQGGHLSADEVYALTALLLHRIGFMSD